MQSMQQASHSNLAEMQAVQNRATAEIVQSINQQHTETVQAMAQLLHAHLPKQPAAPPPKHLKPPPPLPGAEPGITENAKGEGKNKGGDKGGGKDKGGNKDKGGDKDKGGSKDKGGKQFGPEERPPQKKKYLRKCIQPQSQRTIEANKSGWPHKIHNHAEAKCTASEMPCPVHALHINSVPCMHPCKDPEI